jgi:ABC-type multidrug transport system fused ATPase/permease subunit
MFTRHVWCQDEATSAVDPNTDEIIQAVLRKEALMHGTTILTIAHRSVPIDWAH